MRHRRVGDGPAVATDLPPPGLVVTTDAERLRTALVNLLANARQAVAGARAARRRACAVRGRLAPASSSRCDRTATGRVSLRIARPRHRDPSRGPAAHLRSVLHDPAGRHRPRPADCQEHRRRPRRHARRPEQRRRAPTIDIELPATAAETPTAVMSATGSILLVDDEEKILKTLGRALRDEGHEVVEAASAREAQRLLAERRSTCSSSTT